MSDINHTMANPGAYHSVIPPNTVDNYPFQSWYPTYPTVNAPPPFDEWAELRRAIAKRYQDEALTLEQAILATQRLRGK